MPLTPSQHGQETGQGALLLTKGLPPCLFPPEAQESLRSISIWRGSPNPLSSVLLQHEVLKHGLSFPPFTSLSKLSKFFKGLKPFEKQRILP